MFLIILFILGLVVGSFLNVVIIRLKLKRYFWQGRSFCLACQRTLGIRDLWPLISFLIQKGRCRYCKKKISWQYPLVELFCGLAFLLVGMRYLGFAFDAGLVLTADRAIYVLRDLVIVSFLMIIFVYDLKHYLILDKVMAPLMVVALIFNLILGFNLFNLVLAAVVGGGFFLAQYLVSRGRWIGGGDIRLGLAMGLILTWPSVITGLLVAYLMGAVVAIILLLGKKKSWQSEIPLGTFLSLATFLVLLYGDYLARTYWHLLS